MALVGPSGSGKSSIINLLLRFYEPQSGSILIDSSPLETYRIEAWRHQIAYVGQSPTLFYGTVSDNLRIGKADATPQELEFAARTAQAHDFIMKLPHGYETMLGERGMRLSGGQAQRLAIARALLKDAPIILLDEPTSQMDAETESLIQQALTELTQNKTVLMVAHRLSTVQRADKIIVLAQGHVVEIGTHESLLKAGGLYARLTGRQTMAQTGGLS